MLALFISRLSTCYQVESQTNLMAHKLQHSCTLALRPSNSLCSAVHTDKVWTNARGLQSAWWLPLSCGVIMRRTRVSDVSRLDWLLRGLRCAGFTLAQREWERETERERETQTERNTTWLPKICGVRMFLCWMRHWLCIMLYKTSCQNHDTVYMCIYPHMLWCVCVCVRMYVCMCVLLVCVWQLGRVWQSR